MSRPDPEQPRVELIQIGVLPQIVPSRTCLACEVCCRFPEPESALRPYFTREEAEAAVRAGLDPSSVPEGGGRVRLVPHPRGQGYLCPAFEPATSECRIYQARPLDCQLYPLAVMWSQDGRRVLLGWDTKCPFTDQGTSDEASDGRSSDEPLRASTSPGPGPGPGPRALRPDLTAFADEIAARLEREDHLAMLAANPSLIGRYQDDVVPLRELERLTARLRGGPAAGAAEGQLVPLTLEDRALVEAAVASCGPLAETRLAAYAFAPHMIWQPLFRMLRTEIQGHLCLFAEYTDGLFMVLPPLGPGPVTGPLRTAFRIMQERNCGTAVSRVENVPEELRNELERAGYCLRPKDPDYLYVTTDVAELAGDRYKSQRSACNQLTRAHRVDYRPLQPRDRQACLALLALWIRQKSGRDLDPIARHMLEDAAAAHRVALGQADALGLVGRVLCVDGAVAGYTFGFPRPPGTFCVLLEIADRSLTGAAQVLFREFSREIRSWGYGIVNTMDASGLGTLAASKEHYHPVHRLPNYIATQA